MTHRFAFIDTNVIKSTHGFDKLTNFYTYQNKSMANNSFKILFINSQKYIIIRKGIRIKIALPYFARSSNTCVIHTKCKTSKSL